MDITSKPRRNFARTHLKPQNPAGGKLRDHTRHSAKPEKEANEEGQLDDGQRRVHHETGLVLLE